MNQVIQFKNPVFRPGLNVTVRLGTKWADSLREHDGTKLDLVSTDGAHIHHHGCEVMWVRLYRLNEIPPAVLDFEHDESCRTFEGCLAEMRSVYNDGVGEDDIVTVIGFLVPEPAKAQS